MNKKILVLSANPKKNSFVSSLAEAYVKSAKKEQEVRLLHLSDMAFNIDLSEGYDKDSSMEEALKLFQSDLEWCDHFVIVTPLWWGSIPAKLKGLIDRTFLPGFAFQYEKGKTIPKKLLTRKTARLIITMDTPPWYFSFFQGAPAIKQLKIATLKFVGFQSVKTKMIGPIINSSKKSREKWIDEVSVLGLNAN